MNQIKLTLLPGDLEFDDYFIKYWNHQIRVDFEYQDGTTHVQYTDESLIADFNSALEKYNQGDEYFDFCNLDIYRSTFSLRYEKRKREDLGVLNKSAFLRIELDACNKMIIDPLPYTEVSQIIHDRVYEYIISKLKSILIERRDFIEDLLDRDELLDYEVAPISLTNHQVLLMLHFLGLFDTIEKRRDEKNIRAVVKVIQPLFPEIPHDTLYPRIRSLLVGSNKKVSDPVNTPKNRKKVKAYLKSNGIPVFGFDETLGDT